MNPELVSQALTSSAVDSADLNFSPVVNIEPRNRHFHKFINVIIPFPKPIQGSAKKTLTVASLSVLEFCWRRWDDDGNDNDDDGDEDDDYDDDGGGNDSNDDDNNNEDDDYDDDDGGNDSDDDEDDVHLVLVV